MISLAAGLAMLVVPMLVGAAPPGAFENLPEPEDASSSEAPPLDDGFVDLGAAAKVEPVPDEPEDELATDEDEAASVAEDLLEAEVPEAPAIPEVEILELKKAKWIKHEVVPGERLDDIALRYDVKRGSLIRWNKLDEDKPQIFAGKSLSVYTKHIPPPQQKIVYTVVHGDTWQKIADAHGVDVDELRIRWNPKVPRKFKAGQDVVVWIDPLTQPGHLGHLGMAGLGHLTKAGAVTTVAGKTLPVVAIPKGGVSTGKPNKGRLVNGVQLPENDKLYTIRRPEEAFGSSHTLAHLQSAIAEWRRVTGYDRELIIGAISKKGGGRISPHSSHQSGRDVDIRMPAKKGIKSSDMDDASDIDWNATWGLISALVATGEVQYIFMSHGRQKHLYEAAKKAGVKKDELERIIQYPSKAKTNNGIVRHAKGHDVHIHVRFSCAANETKCESY
ncbi:penicillin-insensitive murein endopeptidase [Nannocystaceae bacterium ST9]